MFQRSKLRCDKPLSEFAFNFNLRRYTEGKVKVDWYRSVGDGGIARFGSIPSSRSLGPDAARGGHLNVLVWLHDHGFLNIFSVYDLALETCLAGAYTRPLLSST